MSDASVGPCGPIAIAIVEDDTSLRVSLRRLCTVLGFTATAFPSGRNLLDLVDDTAYRPDCLLVDLQMPDMTGLELYRILVERGASVPTIVITADADPEVLDLCASAGLTTCLQKPISADELLATIGQVTKDQ